MKATATQSGSGMRIIPYTPKSFAVVGDTYAAKETLKAMGGAFSDHEGQGCVYAKFFDHRGVHCSSYPSPNSGMAYRTS